MITTTTADAVAVGFSIDIDPETTFDLFTARFSDWYPGEYTWSQEVLKSIGIEPWVGGKCYELGPDNFRMDWGKVIVWEPPRRIIFTWQIGADRVPVSDPTRAGEVEVTFAPVANGGTDCQLTHRGFDHYSGDSNGYLAAMASAQGWPMILTRFRDFANSRR